MNIDSNKSANVISQAIKHSSHLAYCLWVVTPSDALRSKESQQCEPILYEEYFRFIFKIAELQVRPCSVTLSPHLSSFHHKYVNESNYVEKNISNGDAGFISDIVYADHLWWLSLFTKTSSRTDQGKWGAVHHSVKPHWFPDTAVSRSNYHK